MMTYKMFRALDTSKIHSYEVLSSRLAHHSSFAHRYRQSTQRKVGELPAKRHFHVNVETKTVKNIQTHSKHTQTHSNTYNTSFCP